MVERFDIYIPPYPAVHFLGSLRVALRRPDTMKRPHVVTNKFVTWRINSAPTRLFSAGASYGMLSGSVLRDVVGKYRAGCGREGRAKTTSASLFFQIRFFSDFAVTLTRA